MHAIELVPKKEGNSNIMAIWPCHVILLVISSNNIPLSLPIAFTYHLISDNSLFQYIKAYQSIIENCVFYIALLRSIPAVILFVEKHTIRHHILLRLTSSPLFFLLPFYNYWAVGFKIAISWFKDFFRSCPQLRTKKTWWQITRLT